MTTLVLLEVLIASLSAMFRLNTIYMLSVAFAIGMLHAAIVGPIWKL